MGLNDLKIEVYSSGTTKIYDPGNELIRADGLRFTTIYPGGIFGDCQFRVPRDVRQWWEALGGKRLVVRNGMRIVWEGQIDNQVSGLGDGSAEVEVRAIGYWGTILGRRRWNKLWCDMRLEEAIWPVMATSGSVKTEKYNFDRREQLMIYPKGQAFAVNDYGVIGYYAGLPTGETIKRVTFSYDFQEAAQNWNGKLRDTTNTTDLWTISASGTGTQDITLGTPSTQISFQMYSGAIQTAPGDETIYLKITNLKVYTETGAIDLTEIAEDIRAKITDLNATDVYIGSNTFALEPFISDGYQEISGILEAAAVKGDSSYNRWGSYLEASEMAPSPDGKPVLVVEQQGALTDYDYALRLEEIDPSFSFDRYYDELWNWIIVKYQDENGKDTWLTPSDDATLTDATSTADYGQRDYVLDLGQESATTAANAGRTYLAEHKDPKYRMSGAINVKGSIRTKQGIMMPACQIRAGKRIKIENFLQDLSGTGLTFLIGQTDYDAEMEECQITAGSDLAGELKLL